MLLSEVGDSCCFCFGDFGTYFYSGSMVAIVKVGFEKFGGFAEMHDGSYHCEEA